ncbi:hypothetical protein G9A89_017322 [Geosiphon pyriformis]|nr:hypothetical protein G9A89_017322 [Geosiphon pyriformis]
MITHIALNSHPDPKKVLVIEGSNSDFKTILPGMAVGFDHSKVIVHIGDGFPFLEDKINSFDVFITDASDLVGPAESLFQAK